MVLPLKGKGASCAICQLRNHEEIYGVLFVADPEEGTGEDVKGPGREEWYFEEGRIGVRGGSIFWSHGMAQRIESRLRFRKTEF